MAVLPFFHIYGMVVIMMLGLASGGTIVVMPRFDLQEFLELVQKYRVTILPLVPPIVLGLVEASRSSTSTTSPACAWSFSGAAPLGEDIARALSGKLGCPVVQGYGMTEASPVTHLSPTRDAPVKPGSAGTGGAEHRGARSSTSTPARPSRRARRASCWMRGPQIMKGYLDRPAGDRGLPSTARAGTTPATSATSTTTGCFFIVDRTKELIKYKGLQVAPAELEALLLTHPAILDAAVIRKADEEAGEVPKAFVVLKPDEASRATDAEAIMAWVAERVAPHKRIRQLEFIDQIPKSASGKILRRVLIDRGSAMRRAHLLRWRPRPPCHVTRETIGPTNFRLRGPDMAPHSPYASTPRVRSSGAASQLDPSHRSSRVSPTRS